MSWNGLLPGFYLGYTPDLSPGTPVFKWLQKTKTPFYVMTNYANPKYTDEQGAAIYQALSGPLAEQFMGFIHGEAIGTLTVGYGDQSTYPKDRRGHLDAMVAEMKKQQAAEWSKFFKTSVPESFWSKGISCLSCDSIALCHAFHESGRPIVGYEIDATNVHAPMRIAFERGAARQYGGNWINYASGNFGDACNYFSQEPVVPRGAKSWFHSKYAVTDGVTVSWYRKLYYLNFLGGASAIYWEQNLANQWILPGPGTHPIQLSPFGRATTDFMDFVSRLEDRGEPYTPVAILLSHGHGYERVNYKCKMLHVFPENADDRELRELFNVCWYPSSVREARPISPDLQSMPPGVYGDIFDIQVDRPGKSQAIFNYPIVWAAGDVDLSGPWVDTLRDYVTRGGTLVVNIERANTLPADLIGLRLGGKRQTAEHWSPTDGNRQLTTPFELETIEIAGARPLAIAGEPGWPIITRHAVGEGAVIVTLVPRMMGQDERAHPALPWLMNGLTRSLLPIEIVGVDGKPVRGKVGYQVNRTKTGWLVGLMNHDGLDKTQHGIARVDRTAYVDVVIKTPQAVKSAKEFTSPRDLQVQNGSVIVRVHPGDVQVVGLISAEAQN
jgi:hypothetical protein